MEAGRIVVFGAPWRGPDAASQRLRSVLATADVIVAADTGPVAALATDLGVTVTGEVVPYTEAGPLVVAARGGACVALMAAARDHACVALVAAAHEAGVPVTAVPGPDPVTTALAVAGLPCDRFYVEGFPPRDSTRRSWLARFAGEQRTLVLFEAPDRVAGTLADLAASFGPERLAALCQPDEPVRRGSLGTLTDVEPRGEVTLVVAGAPPAAAPDEEILRAAVAARRAAGASHRDAVAAVAREYGVRRRAVYELTR
jgi:16S rRNA (cytidine1402-2'-O)-methyltransferase